MMQLVRLLTVQGFTNRCNFDASAYLKLLAAIRRIRFPTSQYHRRWVSKLLFTMASITLAKIRLDILIGWLDIHVVTLYFQYFTAEGLNTQETDRFRVIATGGECATPATRTQGAYVIIWRQKPPGMGTRLGFVLWSSLWSEQSYAWSNGNIFLAS